jgi:hypothetical protein
MHHAIGLGLLVVLIGFAFGERTARRVVGAALIIAALALLYVVARVVSGTV